MLMQMATDDASAMMPLRAIRCHCVIIIVYYAIIERLIYEIIYYEMS